MQVISSDQIKTHSVKVTEKIQNRYLKEFIKNSLENDNLTITANTYYYYTFLEEYFSYEIIFFEKTNKKFILEPFLFTAYYHNKDTKSIDIFLTHRYFVIYKNQELLLFKNISNISIEDLNSFIIQTYKIEVNNIIPIDETKLSKLKKEYLSNNTQKSITFIPFKYSHSFNIFLSFFFISSISLGYYLNTKSNQVVEQNNPIELINIQNKYLELRQIYKNNEKKPIDKIIRFFQYLKENSITLSTLKYQHTNINTTLFHKNKIHLLNSIADYQKEIKINSLTYNKQKQNYQMDITLEF